MTIKSNQPSDKLKSKLSNGKVMVKELEARSFWRLIPLASCLPSGPFLGLWLHLSSLCLCHHSAFSLCVPVTSQHLLLRTRQSFWTRNHATQVQLSLNQ